MYSAESLVCVVTLMGHRSDLFCLFFLSNLSAGSTSCLETARLYETLGRFLKGLEVLALVRLLYLSYFNCH